MIQLRLEHPSSTNLRKELDKKEHISGKFSTVTSRE